MVSIISILLWLILFGVAFGLIFWIVNSVAPPAPWRTLILAAVGIIFVLLLLAAVMGQLPLPRLGV